MSSPSFFLSKRVLPTPFYDPETVLINWKDGAGYRLIDALSGSLVLGRSGSGKTSGPGRLARSTFLRKINGLPGMSGLVLFAKNGEADEWVEACKKEGRAHDVIRVTAGGPHTFNFLDWISSWGEGGERGPIAVVSLVEEIATASNPDSAGSAGDDNAFFQGAFRTKLMNLVSIIQLAKLRVSIPLMRLISNSSPETMAQGRDPTWRRESLCYRVLQEAEAITKNDPAAQADYEECHRFFLVDWPQLSEKTRGVVVTMFTNLTRPLLTRPLRPLFCETTTVTPESIVNDGKIVLVDIPAQEYSTVGKMAALIWKRCYQLAIMRRSGPPGSLRPSFIFADEAQTYLTPKDVEYQAVARSGGGVSFYLTQQISSIRQAFGNNDKAENFISNLSTKWLCGNSGETAEWGSQLIGERYLNITGINVGRGSGAQESPLGGATTHAGMSRSEQKRAWVEPGVFNQLRYGSAVNDYLVDAVVFSAGHFFSGENGPQPYKIISFRQR